MLTWDRGTWVVEPEPGLDPRALPGVLWDERTRCWRAPAWRYRDLAPFGPAAMDLSASGRAAPDLRPYQETAVVAWDQAGQRGIVALPTGAGKTRTAIGAIARAGVSALVLAPTRVLVEQWRAALLAAGLGPVGQVADGVQAVERITVATTSSARLYADRLGARFALLVVDEVHHHGGEDETLELYAAPLRLGLTATVPEDAGRRARLETLVGPVVLRIGVDELAGEYLSTYDLVQLAVDLDPEEADAYQREMAAFRAVHGPWWRAAADRRWLAFVRAAVRSDEGRRALAAWRRARQRVAWPAAKDRALEALLRAHARAKVLVFTLDNAVAYTIARRHLIAPLTCDIGKPERQRVLAAFAGGTLHALVSARVLNEGVDVPEADVAIVTGGSQGSREYVQRVGRVLRRVEGKRALVVELVTRGTHEVSQHERNRSRLAAS